MPPFRGCLHCGKIVRAPPWCLMRRMFSRRRRGAFERKSARAPPWRWRPAWRPGATRAPRRRAPGAGQNRRICRAVTLERWRPDMAPPGRCWRPGAGRAPIRASGAGEKRRRFRRARVRPERCANRANPRPGSRKTSARAIHAFSMYMADPCARRTREYPLPDVKNPGRATAAPQNPKSAMAKRIPCKRCGGAKRAPATLMPCPHGNTATRRRFTLRRRPWPAVRFRSAQAPAPTCQQARRMNAPAARARARSRKTRARRINAVSM